MLRIASIFLPSEGGRDGRDREHVGQPQSLYQRIALQVSSNLDCNDLLMKRMEVLSGRKEFSNDPTSDMAEISDLFQKKVTVIKGDMEQLKQLSDTGNGQDGSGPHQHQHYKLVFQALNKRMLKHIDSFQHAVKLQSALVEQRVKRVSDKYGQGTAQISRYAATKETLAGGKDSPLTKGAAGGVGSGHGVVSGAAAPNYAMFAPRPLIAEPLLQSGHGHELRRRGGGMVTPTAAAARAEPPPFNKGTADNKYLQRSPYSGGSTNTGWSGPTGFMQQEQQHHVQQLQQQPAHQKSQMRFKLAEKAEAQIAQMGQLFQQMASLVVEQSETISRIEDDVENGLVDTKEGHKHLTDYHELSKGNRGMIIKIFLLLVAFILLFCWVF